MTVNTTQAAKNYAKSHRPDLETALKKQIKGDPLNEKDKNALKAFREEAGGGTVGGVTQTPYLRKMNEALADAGIKERLSSTYDSAKLRDAPVDDPNCQIIDKWEAYLPKSAAKPKPKPKPHLAAPRPKPAKPEASRPEVEEAEPAVEEEPAEPVRRVEKTVTEEADTMNDLGGLRGSVSVREREEDDGPSPWLFALGAFGSSLGSIAACFNQGGGCYTPQPCFNGGGCPPPPRCGGGPFQIGPVYYTDGDTWPWGRMPPGINLGGGFSNGNYAGASSTASSYPYDPMAVNMARHNHNFHNT